MFSIPSVVVVVSMVVVVLLLLGRLSIFGLTIHVRGARAEIVSL